MKRPKFTVISQNEIRLDYKDLKFMLVEQKRGVYSIGRAVQLYQMDGFQKTHIKELGWTKTDNHDGPGASAYLRGIVTVPFLVILNFNI